LDLDFEGIPEFSIKNVPRNHFFVSPGIIFDIWFCSQA